MEPLPLNKANSFGNSNFYSFDDDPPIQDLADHTMAVGATPLAARESAIRAQMTMKEDEYTYTENFRIFVGTWNINGQNVSESLKDFWLACDPSPPDIYAIGFQELDLSNQAFLLGDSPKEEMWFKACKEGLHPKASYDCIKLVRLVGMMLIVFIKKELKQYVTNVSAEVIGTGILGRMVCSRHQYSIADCMTANN